MDGIIAIDFILAGISLSKLSLTWTWNKCPPRPWFSVQTSH
jgi:hypothetical protein